MVMGHDKLFNKKDGEQAFPSFPVTIKRIRVTRWAADLQIDSRARWFATEDLRFSKETRKSCDRKVRGVRRPRKSGSEERPLPSLVNLRPVVERERP